MPPYLAPHKSGAHRTAALALYRALLSQARLLPLEQETSSRVRTIIQERFRDARFVTSARQLKLLFTAGYQGVDLLDGAVSGDEGCVGRVRGLVERARMSEPRSRQVGDEGKMDMKKERDERYDVLARPLPKELLSGKRRVPVLVNANHIPTLRLTKPQPPALSGYLHSRIKQRQRRHDRRDMLEAMLGLAGEEERWDQLVGEKDGSSWTDAVSEALSVVKGQLDWERESNRVWAERLQGVVDREREALERERAEERERKSEKKEDQKQIVESNTDPVE